MHACASGCSNTDSRTSSVRVVRACVKSLCEHHIVYDCEQHARACIDGVQQLLPLWRQILLQQQLRRNLGACRRAATTT
jgi:hypothetical protein